MLLMWWSQAIIHFKAGSLETAAKKGKHLKHRVGKKGTWAGYAEQQGLVLESEMAPASPFLLGACPVALASIPGTDGCKTWGEVWPKCGNSKFKKHHICPAHILSSPCGGGGEIQLWDSDLWPFMICVQNTTVFRSCSPALIAHYIFPACLI